MNNIQVAFIDLDGTLLNNKKIITDNNIKALKILKEKNIKVVISTGRWDSYVYNLVDNTLVDYIITNNGACIIDMNTNKPIYEEYFNNKEINNIVDYCNKNNLELIFNGLFKRYTTFNNIDTNIYQGVIICNSINDIDNLINYTTNTNLKLAYISSAYYKKIEYKKYTTNINLLKTNKGNTIKYLLNILNIDKENSICFGDNNNDIEMFNECGYKIAMENGLQELKNKADFITLDNNNDGVYYFIKKYF